MWHELNDVGSDTELWDSMQIFTWNYLHAIYSTIYKAFRRVETLFVQSRNLVPSTVYLLCIFNYLLRFLYQRFFLDYNKPCYWPRKTVAMETVIDNWIYIIGKRCLVQGFYLGRMKFLHAERSYKSISYVISFIIGGIQ